jgi:hypothetical protein
MNGEAIRRVMAALDVFIKLFDLLIRAGEVCIVIVYLAVGYSVFQWLTKELPACK